MLSKNNIISIIAVIFNNGHKSAREIKNNISLIKTKTKNTNTTNKVKISSIMDTSNLYKISRNFVYYNINVEKVKQKKHSVWVFLKISGENFAPPD